jgi:hypothetical protein
MNAHPSDRYTCLHTISLSENVDAAAFEQAMLDQIMPQTHVSRRNINRLDLEHRLLQRLDDHGLGQYIWQVRASNLEMVSQEPDYEFMIRSIEEDVGKALTPWGNVDSATAFREIGGVEIT